jgi:hypothetical protein
LCFSFALGAIALASIKRRRTLPAEVGQQVPPDVERFGRVDIPQEGRGTFTRRWVVPLLAGAAVCFFVAFFLWREGFAVERQPRAIGGLLLFVDSEETRSQIVEDEPVAAAVDAQMWETGFPNTSLLSLSLKFANPKPGLRWYVVVSGQYNPDPGTDVNTFCVYGGTPTRMADRVRCRNVSLRSAIDGSTDIEYRFGDRIGSIYEEEIHKISDSFDGYIDGDSTVITGRLISSDRDSETLIHIPFPTPHHVTIAGDELWALAPIAPFDRGDYGTAEKIRSLPPQYADTSAYFASVSTGHPIDFIRLPTLSLELREGLDGRELAWASPPPDRPDVLAWSTDRGGDLGPFSFRIHDAVAQTGIARRSFLAGVFVSVGAALLVLLLEQWLTRKSKPRSFRL